MCHLDCLVYKLLLPERRQPRAYHQREDRKISIVNGSRYLLHSLGNCYLE